MQTEIYGLLLVPDEWEQFTHLRDEEGKLVSPDLHDAEIRILEIDREKQRLGLCISSLEDTFYFFRFERVSFFYSSEFAYQNVILDGYIFEASDLTRSNPCLDHIMTLLEGNVDVRDDLVNAHKQIFYLEPSWGASLALVFGEVNAYRLKCKVPIDNKLYKHWACQAP